MATAIVMPRLGMTMKQGTVIEWRATVGDSVAKGDVILLIESEKAEAEIEAPISGVLRHVYVEPERTVPSGTLLAAMTETADEPFDPEAFAAEYLATDDRARGAAETPSAVSGTSSRAASRTSAVSGTRRGRGSAPAVTPAARRRARELGVDVSAVEGTGPGGRITREDVERAAAQAGGAANAGGAVTATGSEDASATPGGSRLLEVAPGVSLEVFESGTAGDTVMLVPGLGTDVSVFAGVAPALAERFRVLAINPRGVGASSAPQSDAYDLETAAADVAAVAPEPVHLVGTSLGAAVAIETALAHPQIVRSLTLITPFLQVSGRLIAFADSWVRLVSGTDGETVAAAIVPWMFSASFLADERQRRRALRGLTQVAVNVRPETVARQTAGLSGWAGRRAADLAAISVPAMIIAAGDDILVGDGREVAAAIPAAARVVVGEAGHAVTVEAPDVVARLCLAHLLR